MSIGHLPRAVTRTGGPRRAPRVGTGGQVRRVESPAAPMRRVAGLLVTTVWFALPLVPMVLWAGAQSWPFPAALPVRWGLGGWVSAWDQGAAHAALNSLGLGALVAALATPVGAAAARALALSSLRFGRTLTALLLLPVAVPPFAVVMGLSTMTLRAHVPAPAAVIAVLVVGAVPYTTYVMHAAYAGYDTGFEDAARSLGARRRDVLLRVHLPLVAPALAAAAFLAFLVAWSDYVVTLVLGAGRTVTLPLLLGSAASGSGNTPTVAALALLTVLPPTLLLLTATRLTRRKAKP